jgi:hypothetical protein
VNNDGTVDSADSDVFIFASIYEADLDLTMNGLIGTADQAVVTSNLGRTLGSSQLSDRGNIVGWCGYLYEEAPSMKRGHVAGPPPLADPRTRTLA